MAAIHRFLNEPLVHALLDTHPNNAVSVVPDPLLPWWTDPPHWSRLHDHPLLHSLIHSINTLQLSRVPIQLPISIPQSTHRVSTKKHHEVSRMTQFIADLLPARLPRLHPSHIRIVDIGAGQAYITRALHTLFNAYTLALDSDYAQTNRAQSRCASNRITHKTIHITPLTLLREIDDWIPSTTTTPSRTPIPVLLVALHACGSLTPDILRAFLSVLKNPSDHPTWTPVAVVAIGCCYNLMSLPTDFPLSSSLLSAQPPLHFPTSAFHLAAQVPSNWNNTPASLAAATLAIRKVVWRALLTRLTPVARSDPPATDKHKVDTGTSLPMRRLGRLNDNAYTTWETFLKKAGERLGADFTRAFQQSRGDVTANSDSDPEPHSDTPPEFGGRDALLERRLEVLHVLRCLLGPVVESLIVLDRLAWVREALSEMSGGTHMQVEAVNLFDQATGSGRNIAIVIAPAPPTSEVAIPPE